MTEGLLGRVPENAESIAELMLFDSDINVYGESNVYIPEFDFKNRVIKSVNNKAGKFGKQAQKKFLANEKQIRTRQNYRYGQQQNIAQLQEAPETIRNRAEFGYNGLGVPQDTLTYAPVTQQAPTYTFKTDIEMAGPVADLQEFENKYKEHEKQRRELKA